MHRALAEGAVASWVNLGEVYYISCRAHGTARATEVIAAFTSQLTLAEPAGAQVSMAAAALKVSGGLSYADCFAVATAERHDLPLFTGDPEILRLKRPGLKIVDLR